MRPHQICSINLKGLRDKTMGIVGLLMLVWDKSRHIMELLHSSHKSRDLVGQISRPCKTNVGIQV